MRKVPTMKLADELVLVTLSPVEPRNTRNHQGIRAAVCGADVLETWFAGGPLPGDLRRHIRKYNHQSLEPVLMRLTAAGQITTRPGRGLWGMMGARYETLVDVQTGAAIRGRLQACLAAASVPSPRDAALAVLIIQARLWDWAELESIEGHRRFGGPPTGAPLWSHGAALAEGRQRLPQDTAGVLNLMAKEIDREYRISD
jgi:hypothetical protein